MSLSEADNIAAEPGLDQQSQRDANNAYSAVCPTESPVSYAFSGLLYKLGDSLGIWNVRYFLLEESRLIHFLNINDTQPRRILKLKQQKY